MSAGHGNVCNNARPWQSERSEVCRGRTREKYLLPVGWAGRREAVVRCSPEAGREPPGGGRERVLSAGRGDAERDLARRLQPQGRAGEYRCGGDAQSR